MGNTPNVRFKGFTEDWKQRKLKDVIIDAYQGINTTADKVMYSNEGIPVLQAKHITTGSIDFTDVRYLKKEQYSEYFPKYTPQKGDMLFANIGTIGPSTIVENQGEFLIAWNILRIVFNKNLVDAYFVHLIFDKYKDSGYFERMQTGNATKFINKDNIFDINLFMPSEVEQHKIGGYFRNLDYLITLHQQKCDEIKELKKYMLQNMFPQKDEKVPKIRFAGFTGDWEQRMLGNIATFINGRAYSQDELLSSGKYKVLRVGNFYTNDSWYYSDMELDDKYYAEEGDLLYTWSATFGPHIWHGDKVIYHYHIWKVELSDALEKNFAVQLMEKDKQSILSDKNGSTMVHITKSGMESKEVILPSNIKEQAKIGEYFYSLDNLITLHQQKCAALKEFKKYMLQNMFPQKGENKCQN